MKKFLLMLGCVWLSAVAGMAQKVVFEVRDGIYDQATKAVLERNLSALLTEINRAQAAGSPLDFRGIGIAPSAQSSLSMLWANVPFRCEDDEIVESVSNTPDGGLQVRNIALELKPADGTVSDDSYQEAVVDFDSRGTIQSFYFGLSINLYRQVMLHGKEVGDLRRRQMILDYVEHFRTAYNQKDIDFLWQVFSDDAIIITGKVIRTEPNDYNPFPQDKIIYNTQSKTEYLTRLKGVFDRSKYIRVNFSEIQVTRHPTKSDFYGVLLRQGYDSGYYSDDGYVFLLWDFRNEAHPEIHVRTWQPYYLDAAKTKVIDENEIFDISALDL